MRRLTLVLARHREGIVRAVLAGIVIAALLIRIYPLSARSFWFDEAFTWRLIDYPWAEMFERAARDNSPPFYYVLLKLWAEVFGVSPAALRSLSLLCGLATVLGAYLFCVEAFGNEGEGQPSLARAEAMGLLAAALVAFSALQIRYSWEARMYALATTLTVFSSWALLRALRGGSRRRGWLLYALLAALLGYTHYYGLYTLAGHAVFAVVFLLHRAKWNLTALWRLPEVWDGLGALALVIAAWLPWLPAFLHQHQAVRHSGWLPPLSGWDLGEICYRMLAVPEYTPRPSHDAILWVTIPCLIGVAFLSWRACAGAWLILCSALSPFVLCALASKLGTQATTLRYFVMAQAFVAIGLAALVFRIPFVLERGAVAAAVLAAFLLTSFETYDVMDLPNRPGARAAAEFILRQRRPGEPVIVSSPLYYAALFYHAHKPADFFIYTDGSPMPRHYGTAVLTPEELMSREQMERLDGKRVWVVNMASQYWGTQSVPAPAQWVETGRHTVPDLLGVGDFHVVEYRIRETASAP